MDSQHVISRWGNDWLSKLHEGHLLKYVKPARNKLDRVGKMLWMIFSWNIMSFAPYNTAWKKNFSAG